MNCIFCNILSGAIPSYKIWEDDHFYAFLDIHPIKKGHTLIIPKLHTEDIFSLPETVYTDLFVAGKKLQSALQQAVQSKKVGFVVEGFGVAHAHLHLIPINTGNELDPHSSYTASTEELEMVQREIQKYIAQA